MRYETIRKQVLDAILEAVDLGLVKGTSGNIAVRDMEEEIAAITPSGIAYQTMRPEDITIVGLNGTWIDGPYKPSSETPMHTAVFRAREEVKATVHTHSMYATVLAMGDEELKAVTPPHAEFVPIRTVPFAMPGSAELAQAVADNLGAGRAVLLKNHGMFCCGKNIKAAMTAAVYVEEMAEITYRAKLLGVFEPMLEEDVLKMKEFIAKDLAV